MMIMTRMKVFQLWLLVVFAVDASDAKRGNPVLTTARRFTDLSGIFGSERSTPKTAYERVGNHPVFQVTTAWGAAYMNFEKKSTDKSGDKNKDIPDGGTENEMRPVTLFYMDPDDALRMHAEMNQIDSKEESDIRITATTLSKAIRQAANLGDGLPTGAAVDPLTGDLPSINDGGSLRYKIVPSTRQLFYATRCRGKERVGFFSESDTEDATSVLQYSLDSVNQQNRREAMNRKVEMTGKYAHMEGYSGIPVFYSPALRKRRPLIKSLGWGRETNPLFFSYEDLYDTWTKMRKNNKAAPSKPPAVEVFNLLDVLTSMDRTCLSQQKKYKFRWRDPAGSLKQQMERMKETLTKKYTGPDIDSVTFIPPKNSVEFKEKLSAMGNGKARLRPMR